MSTLNCKQCFTSKRRESRIWNASIMITATSATTSSSSTISSSTSSTTKMNHCMDEGSPIFYHGFKTRDKSGTWKHHHHGPLKHSYSSM